MASSFDSSVPSCSESVSSFLSGLLIHALYLFPKVKIAYELKFSQISQVNKDEIRSPSARRLQVHRESERKRKRERERDRERERSVVGEAIAVDPSATTADSRHRQPQPIGDRPATEPRSHVAGTTVSTSDATAEFWEFQCSRSLPSIRLDRGVCRGNVPLYTSGSQVILISEKMKKSQSIFSSSTLFVSSNNNKKVKGIEVLRCGK